MQGQNHFEPDPLVRVMSWVLALLTVAIVALYRMGVLSPADSEPESPFGSPVTVVVPVAPLRAATNPPSTDGYTEFGDGFHATLSADTFWPGGPPTLLPHKHIILTGRLRAAGPHQVAVETCRDVAGLHDELQAGVRNYAASLKAAFLDADWSIVPGSEACHGRIAGARLLAPSASADTVVHIIDAFGAAGIPLHIVEQPDRITHPTPPTIQVDWQQ